MKTSAKLLTLAFAAIAALYFAFFSVPEDAAAVNYSTDPLTYPVLLVHGLGDGPGEETFGKLQEFLEKFYFNVEVMDFSTVSKVAAITSKVKKAKRGGLDHLAAALGNKINRIRKQRKSDKVNIVAHSYGGLIVQAYLLNYGADIDKKNGKYDGKVNKVVYLQTPFYGSNADPEYIKSLALETDYSVFLNAKKITETLAEGSEWLHKMDEAMRTNEIYTADGVDAITLTSDGDEIVSVQNSTLEGFAKKIYNHDRYRVFKDYTHSTNPMSVGTSETSLGSLAYVRTLTDANFVAISSFLDNGKRWRRTGKGTLADDCYLIIKYEKEAGYTDLAKTDVTLTYKGAVPGSRRAKGSKKPVVVFNEEARTFVFKDFVPGTYKLVIKNSKNDGVNQDFVFEEKDQIGFHYYPAKNELFEGGRKINSNLKGLYVLPQFTITDAMSENLSASLAGLSNNFDVEFDFTGAQNTRFDKGRIFVIYNDAGSSGSSWNANGGRLEVQIRGWMVHNNDLIHAGKIALGAVFDKNKNGNLDDDLGEWYEGKGEDKSNDWKLNKHHVLIRVRWDGSVGRVTLFHNNKQIATHEFSGPYYNSKPVLSIGGRRHDLDYQAPIGCVITDFVIRNVTN